MQDLLKQTVQHMHTRTFLMTEEDKENRRDRL